MAKSIRSKSKKRFRTLRRENVVEADWQVEAEAKKQEALQAVLAAPRPSEAGGEGGEAAGPVAMDGAQGDAAMAVDGLELAEGANPSKLLKKLRKKRMAVTKGIVKGQTKRSKPLAGANQFHKKKKKLK